MNWLRTLIVFAVALVLTAPAGAADKAKKKKELTVKGTVVEVKKDTDKDSGSLIVKVIVGKKKDNNTAEKTYKVSETTKVEKVVGKAKKGQPAPEATAAKLGDIQKGDTVALTAKGDDASAIKFTITKKKKNK
jgi:hypothetical protein